MLRSKIFIVTILLLISLNIKSQDLQLNEVVSKNYNGLESFEDKTEDWIEIFNNSNDTIQLSDYFLSDEENILSKWQFPLVEIFPDSFLVVFASTKDITIPEIHTNFKINSEGEKLFLSKLGGQIIDTIQIPELKADLSYGRIDENQSIWSYLDFPSPSYSNASSNHLTFSHQSGFYDDAFQLTISSLRPNQTIYYTTDGSEPNTNSKIFTSLLIENINTNENRISKIITTVDHPDIQYQSNSPDKKVDKAVILKTASYFNNVKNSKTYQKTYFVNSKAKNIPVISIVADENALFNADTGIYIPGNHWNSNNPEWTGNYMNRGENWERDIDINYFDENKELIFEQKAGVRIHGGLSRTFPQKSLRIYARKKYGSNSFEIPFFGNLRYDKFILKNSYAAWNRTILTEHFALKCAESFHFEQQKFKPVLVYLNGEYWGIHFLGERIDNEFLEEKFDIKQSDSLNLIGQSIGINLYGSNQDYLDLKEFIAVNDVSIQSNYKYVANQIDIKNFIDYHIFQMFFNNRDWPSNNIKMWNLKNKKWRYILYDLDATTITLGHKEEYNMFEHMTTIEGPDWPNPPESNLIYRNLIENENFRDEFILRYIELLDSEFSTENLRSKLMQSVSEISPYIDTHMQRWDLPNNIYSWENDLIKYIFDFIEKRQCIVNDQIIESFNLPSSSYICNEKNLDLSFNLFPNPTQNFITLSFTNKMDQPSYLDYKISDSLGKIVKSNSKIVLGETTIFVGDLSKGVYFFNITNEYGQPVTNKFIIY